MSISHRPPAVSCSRRSFLRLAGSAAAGFPLILRAARKPANSRVNLAIIGCGNQAEVDLKEWLPMADVQVVAVCDVNRGSHGYKTEKQFLGRDPVRDLVEAHYAKTTDSGSYRGCATYSDFRGVLARPDIDAVAIITPDHWHGIMTTHAAAAGKDIYCQKPLGLTIRDGQEMIRAVRKYKRILQTGSQWRSNEVIRRCCEAVRNGVVGKIQRVETYVAPNNFTGPGVGWQEMPVPEGLNYDLWLGPAQRAPYHKDRCFYRFRFISEYSGGQTTNFGAHSNDVAQWGLGTDDTMPVEFEGLGAEFPPNGDLFDTATKVNFRCRYENGVELVCATDKRSFGVRFEGDKGWISTNGKTIEGSSDDVKNWQPGTKDKRLYESANHYRNFIDCVRSREEPISPVEVGHHTAAICHLGNAAMKLNRIVKWDAKKEVVMDDNEAAALLQKSQRSPWSYAS